MCFRKSLQSMRMCSSLSLLLIAWWPKSHIRVRKMTWVFWWTKRAEERHTGRSESPWISGGTLASSGFTLFDFFFYTEHRPTLTGKRPWETRRPYAVPTSFQRRSVFLLIYIYIFFKEKRSYEVRKREHLKNCCEGASQCRPCTAIWALLAAASRGMEKIIHRNVWGALKRSAPRDRPMGELNRVAG